MQKGGSDSRPIRRCILQFGIYGSIPRRVAPQQSSATLQTAGQS